SAPARKEQRHGSRVLVKCRSVVLPQLLFLAPHHRGVEPQEVQQQYRTRCHRTRGHAGTQSKDGTAQVEWIPRIRVGTGRGQPFLFVKISRCVGAHAKPNCPEQSSGENALRSRTSEPQHRDRNQISASHAPSRKELAARGHTATPKRRCSALNT